MEKVARPSLPSRRWAHGGRPMSRAWRRKMVAAQTIADSREESWEVDGFFDSFGMFVIVLI